MNWPWILASFFQIELLSPPRTSKSLYMPMRLTNIHTVVKGFPGSWGGGEVVQFEKVRLFWHYFMPKCGDWFKWFIERFWNWGQGMLIIQVHILLLYIGFISLLAQVLKISIISWYRKIHIRVHNLNTPGGSHWNQFMWMLS